MDKKKQKFGQFKAITKHLSLEIPILEDYFSVSGPIFPPVGDYFLSSFFFGYIYEIIRNQVINQLANFIYIFEHLLLPEFNASKHEFDDKLIDSSMMFLVKLKKFANDYRGLEGLDQIHKLMSKKKEMAFVLKVVLFYYISKMREEVKTEEKDIREDLKKKKQAILKNEKIPVENIYFFLLSAALKINVKVFLGKDKPQSFVYKDKNKETLTVAFMLDHRKQLMILSKENTEFKDHIKYIRELETRSLFSEKERISQNGKINNWELKYNKLQRTYKSLVQVASMFFEISENMADEFENISENPGDIDPKRLKMKNQSLINSKLSSIRKAETELNIRHLNDVNEQCYPIDEMKGILKRVGSCLKKVVQKKKLEKGEEEDSEVEDDKTIISADDAQTYYDPERNLLNDQKLAISSAMDNLNNKIQKNIKMKKQRDDSEDEDSDNNYRINEHSEDASIDKKGGQKNNSFDDLIQDKEVKVPMFDCPICCDEVTMNDVFIFECGHKFCNNCVRQSLLTKYENGQWGFEIQCFDGDCSYNMNAFNSMPVLIALIGKEKVENMEDKAARDMANGQCFKCKHPFYIAEDNEASNYYCDNVDCKVWTCLKCGEEKHEQNICKKKWDEMKIALKDERLRCCPVCMEIYLKDDHCEHVKCHKCSTEFCYNCSAPRPPILSHGGHYHRRGCKYFFKNWDKTKKPKEEILEDVIEPKCTECQKNKVVCKRPELDLKTYYSKLGLELENEVNPHDD